SDLSFKSRLNRVEETISSIDGLLSGNIRKKFREGFITLIFLRMLRDVVKLLHRCYGIGVRNFSLDRKRNAILTDGLLQKDIDSGGEIKAEICKQLLSLCLDIRINGNASCNFCHKNHLLCIL